MTPNDDYQVPSLAWTTTIDLRSQTYATCGRWDSSSLRSLETEYGFAASEAATGLYNALFGRDLLWVLLFLLETRRLRNGTGFGNWVREAGNRILSSLASTQGQQVDDATEEQPGKIVHEVRRRPDQRLVDYGMPFVDGKSYAGFDQTFLFISAVRAYAESFGARVVPRDVILSVERAAIWINQHADLDGDGLYEYSRRNQANPVNQSWKDSFDSITHTGFDVPPPPIAWIEVQAYAYKALQDAVWLQQTLPGISLEAVIAAEPRAHAVCEAVEQAFWLD